PRLPEGVRGGGLGRDPFGDAAGALEEGPGGLVVSLAGPEAAQGIEALRRFGAFGARQLLADRQRPLQERARLLQRAGLDVDRAEESEHCRLDLRLPGKLPIDPGRAGIEQILRAQFLTSGLARKRAGEEFAQE